MRRAWLAIILLSACVGRIPRAEIEQGCRNGNADQCVAVAERLIVERDDAHALPWVSRACELGHSRSCIWEGAIYEWGKGVEADRARARRSYDASCTKGSLSACRWRDRLDSLDSPTPCTPPRGGVIDRPTLRAAVVRQQEPMRYCYELARLEEDKVTIDLRFRWIIELDGRVSAVDVQLDSQPHLAVGECIRHQMLKWRLPCPGRRARMETPMRFRWGEADGDPLQ